MAKKIKKLEPIKKCDASNLLDFVKQSNKKEKRNTKARVDRNKPSTIPSLTHWKHNKLEDWVCTDFLGYYFTQYKEIVGEEDIQFAGIKAGYSFGKERNSIKKCLEVYLCDSNLELKNYIDFIIEWWMSEDSWAKDLPNLGVIFNSGTFVKIYKGTKLNKKESRSKLDNKFAEKEQWDRYFSVKGEE